MKIRSVRENPEYASVMIKYVQSKYANENGMMVYEDCINHTATAENPLPQWYLLYKNDTIIGCAGLVTNDFVSRMDLYPWICAVYIEETERGNAYGSLLLERAKQDARAAGFKKVYLCTDHIGYYEHYGFEFLGMGYHPWGDISRIYVSEVVG